MPGRHESLERTRGEGHSSDIWARTGSKILQPGRLEPPEPIYVELFSLLQPDPIMPVAAGVPRGEDGRLCFESQTPKATRNHTLPLLEKRLNEMVTGKGKGGRSVSLPAWQEGGESRGKVGEWPSVQTLLNENILGGEG